MNRYEKIIIERRDHEFMDIELYCTESGVENKDILILLHGNGESSDYFVNQLEFFSREFHVIALDTRGHGRSPRGEGEFTLERFAEDLHDFMQSRGIKRASLLGFSDGANIALIFALRYTEMVQLLILNGANLDPSGVKRSVQIPIIIGYFIASLFARFASGAKANAEMLALMVKEPQIKPSELSKLDVPTLVIAGTRDMIREEHTRLIFRSLPDARLTIIDGDHFIANKCADEFNRAVDEFIKCCICEV